MTNFLQYGVSSSLAQKLEHAGFSVSSVKALSQKLMVSKFGLSDVEAAFVAKAVKRRLISEHIATLLLQSSNFTCNICKGVKSSAYVLHHIVEYEKTQDNDYDNLVVLCPNDHDAAHSPGLTLGITKSQLRKAKSEWEERVERINVQRAANAVRVQEHAVDYVNIRRLEELSLRLLGGLPETRFTNSLQQANILDGNGIFDQKYVRTHLSGGMYLFDYMNSNETVHYSEVLRQLTSAAEFLDIDEVAKSGFAALKSLEGKCGYFVGVVKSKRPEYPVKEGSPPFKMRFRRKGLRIEWILDPNFLMSSSSVFRMGEQNRYIIYCIVRSVTETLTRKPSQL